MNINDLKPAKDHVALFGIIKLRKNFKVSGIYAIRNITTNKTYVGSAINIGERLHKHRSRLRSNIHPNKHLQLAWNKHLEHSFEFVILEYVEHLSLLLHSEECWIEYYNSFIKEFGYNARRKPNSNLGLKFSAESRDKISKSNMGKHSQKRRPLTDKEKEVISKRNKGIKRSQAWIDRNTARLRRPDKWPHGYACKCEPCMKSKSKAIMVRQKARKLEIKNGH